MIIQVYLCETAGKTGKDQKIKCIDSALNKSIIHHYLIFHLPFNCSIVAGINRLAHASNWFGPFVQFRNRQNDMKNGNRINQTSAEHKLASQICLGNIPDRKNMHFYINFFWNIQVIEIINPRTRMLCLYIQH